MDISNHPTLVRTITAHRGHHEQRPAERGVAGDGAAAASRSPRSRQPISSTATSRPARSENTDPALIANTTPPAGSSSTCPWRRTAQFTVQIGTDGPEAGVRLEEQALPHPDPPSEGATIRSCCGASRFVAMARVLSRHFRPRCQTTAEPAKPAGLPVPDPQDDARQRPERDVGAVRLAGDHRLLHGGPHRVAERGGKGALGLRPLLRAHDVPRDREYPQEKYNDVLKSLGADSNAFTTDDWTCYHMTIPPRRWAKAVEIESDRFQNLKYDEPSFQKEARAVLGEYNKSASSPFLKLEEAMQDTAYTTHTYKHTTIGFLADIKDMPNQYAYSKTFFDRWYRPENCTIVVAGDVKHDATGVAGRRLITVRWNPRQGRGARSRPNRRRQEPRSAHLTWPLPTLPTLYLGYHMPAGDPSNPDVAALGALEQAVFGETSPLYRELVLKEQKAVMLMADSSPHRDPGLFTIFVRVRKPGDLVRGPPADRRGIAPSGRRADRVARPGGGQVASPVQLRRVAAKRRRRRPDRRPGDRDHRPTRSHQ